MLSGCTLVSPKSQSASLERKTIARNVKTVTYNEKTIDNMSYWYSDYYDDKSFIDFYSSSKHFVGINSNTQELLYYRNSAMNYTYFDPESSPEQYDFVGTIPDFKSCSNDEERIEAVKRFFRDKVDFSIYNSFDYTVIQQKLRGIPDDWFHHMELNWQVVQDGIPCNTILNVKVSCDGHILEYKNYNATPFLLNEKPFVEFEKLDKYIMSVIKTQKGYEHYDHYVIDESVLCYDEFQPAVRFTVITRDHNDFSIQHMTIVVRKTGWYTQYTSRDIWYTF